jgi:serine/threonine-protein kinase
VPPPDDPAARARVESLRKDLAHTVALIDSGQCASAVDARRKLIADADALGYAPLQAESRAATAHRAVCVEYDELIRSSRRAVILALASHHDEAAADAAIGLAWVLADRMPDPAQAYDWIDIANAIMQGMSGDHPVLEGWRLFSLATVQEKDGQIDRALETIGKALALMERTLGREHLDYAMATMTRGNILLDGKRFEEAAPDLQQGMQLAMRAGGHDHPTAAMAAYNYADALNHLHRYAEARAASLEALRIWRRSAPSPFYPGVALTTLGEALLGEGQPREAATRLEEAVRLVGNDPSSFRQAACFALARALWASSRDQQARALALAREAKLGYQKLGHFAAEVANVDAWLRARGEAAPQRGK